MRISDWSSDVCSSDLFFDVDGGFLVGDDLVLHLAQAARPLLLALEHVIDPLEVGLVAFPRTVEVLARHLGLASGQVEAAALVEIGGASLRARVCKYVALSVVAESLKKKTNKKY